eukprot:jgi/Mesvir1/2827/Mv13921-RA.1
MASWKCIGSCFTPGKTISLNNSFSSRRCLSEDRFRAAALGKVDRPAACPRYPNLGNAGIAYAKALNVNAASKEEKTESSQAYGPSLRTIRGFTIRVGGNLMRGGPEQGTSPLVGKSQRQTTRKRRRLKSESKAAATAVMPGMIFSPEAKSTPRKPRAAPKEKTSVQLYLDDISRTPLLTAEEEIELAKHVQELIRLEQVRDEMLKALGKEASLEEWARRACVGSEQTLRERLVRGLEARERMILSNLRLVVSVAKRFTSRGLPLLDLFQEGVLGLMRGVEKFDHGRGFRFSTYAYWWIRQSVSRGVLDRGRMIRLPARTLELHYRITRFSKNFFMAHNYWPETKDIAAGLDISEDRIMDTIASMQPVASLEALAPGNANSDSSREPWGTLVDDIADTSPSPWMVAEADLLKEDVQRALAQLTPREQTVLRLRYGLQGGKGQTLGEVGRAFSLTRERIRQIELGALKKMRKSAKVLEDYTR